MLKEFNQRLATFFHVPEKYIAGNVQSESAETGNTYLGYVKRSQKKSTKVAVCCLTEEEAKKVFITKGEVN